MNAISVRNLKKIYYNSGVWALKGIDLEISHNKIFCIVGPNGAGKTTLLRILGTQLSLTSGEVYILEYEVMKEASKIRKLIAVVPQEAMVDPELTPYEHIYYYLLARGVGFRESKKRVNAVLSELGLSDVKSKPAANLSGGLRRRVLIGMVIATKEKIMLLDEPTAGLDPLARRDFWKIILELKANSTILLTTHSMEEAEVLADEVAIIDKGKILAQGTPSKLKSVVPYKEKIYIENRIQKEFFEQYGEVKSYGEKLVIYPFDEKNTHIILKIAMEQKVVASLHPIGLEDVFIKVVEKGAE